MLSVHFWFNTTPMLPGHALIETVFKRNNNDKYIILINEGFDKKRYGLVHCRQIYSADIEAGSKYLAVRSLHYRLLFKENIGLNNKEYHAVLDKSIKEINEGYVRNKWIPSDIVKGKIVLNHGCLWYACSLFAKLIGVSMDSVLENPSISIPIIRNKESVPQYLRRAEM